MIYLCNDQQKQQSISEMQQKHYGYIIWPGNNSGVIECALKKRLVWQPMSATKQLLSASFLWRQMNYSQKVYSDFDDILKAYTDRHVLLNHFENNHLITTKSGLIKTLKYYYSHETFMISRNNHIFDILPLSFLLHANVDDTEHKDFVRCFSSMSEGKINKQKVPQKHCEHNVWFIKPESANQGRGISIFNTLQSIEMFLGSKPANSGWIVQKAIEKPLLYEQRKFDIRVWVIVTTTFQIYLYKEPYVRTSSQKYNATDMNEEIHLTNNSFQKKFDDYSKYQEGNTISFEELAKSVTSNYFQFREKIMERIKEIVLDTLISVRKNFGKSPKKKEFQLFGYDFLLDEDHRVWLLEINNNPYIGTPNAFLRQLVPQMVNQMLELVVDPLFPPASSYEPTRNPKFQLIYKQSSLVRVGPAKTFRSFSDGKNKSFYSNQFSKNSPQATQLRDNCNSTKIRYSTPSETLRHLLDTYCFSDLDPFILPTTLLLTSPRLKERENLEPNIKNLRLICQTRIATILTDERLFDCVKRIIVSVDYQQQIEAELIAGFLNACKNFKAKQYIAKKIMPLIGEILVTYSDCLNQKLLTVVIKLLIKLGSFPERAVFIPGQTRQNEIMRDLFISTNCFTLLLYFNRHFPYICADEIKQLIGTFNKKDWEYYYQNCRGKKNKKNSFIPTDNEPQEEINKLRMTISTSIEGERPKITSHRQENETNKTNDFYRKSILEHTKGSQFLLKINRGHEKVNLKSVPMGVGNGIIELGSWNAMMGTLGLTKNQGSVPLPVIKK